MTNLAISVCFDEFRRKNIKKIGGGEMAFSAPFLRPAISRTRIAYSREKISGRRGILFSRPQPAQNATGGNP
jgi:hypothetical protein